jgi:hypothetical protein
MEEIRQEIGNVAPEVAVAVRNASVKWRHVEHYYARNEVPSTCTIRRVIVVHSNSEVRSQREEEPAKEGKTIGLHLQGPGLLTVGRTSQVHCLLCPWADSGGYSNRPGPGNTQKDWSIQ